LTSIGFFSGDHAGIKPELNLVDTLLRKAHTFFVAIAATFV